MVIWVIYLCLLTRTTELSHFDVFFDNFVIFPPDTIVGVQEFMSMAKATLCLRRTTWTLSGLQEFKSRGGVSPPIQEFS